MGIFYGQRTEYSEMLKSPSVTVMARDVSRKEN